MITTNAIYNYVYEKVIAAYPAAYITSVFEPLPAEFPAVFIREIGRFHPVGTVALSGAQGVRETTFEVQIQSNKIGGMKTEACGIADTVTEAFAEIHFVLSNTYVLDEGDSGVYRLRLSYRRTIGAADTLSQ